MRECRLSGSVEGVMRNRHPYSDSAFELACSAFRICERFNEAYYASLSRPILTRASGFLAHCSVAV